MSFAGLPRLTLVYIIADEQLLSGTILSSFTKHESCGHEGRDWNNKTAS